jgi:hypothetical protein
MFVACADAGTGGKRTRTPGAASGMTMEIKTDDVRIREFHELTPPSRLFREFTLTP